MCLLNTLIYNNDSVFLEMHRSSGYMCGLDQHWALSISEESTLTGRAPPSNESALTGGAPLSNESALAGRAPLSKESALAGKALLTGLDR